MKISIIGAGNMGGAIASGLAASGSVLPRDITVIDHKGQNVPRLKAISEALNVVVNDYTSLSTADMIIIAVKPWMVEEVLKTHRDLIAGPKQLIVSIAAIITLSQLQEWTSPLQPVFRVVPNTAIAVRQSMTYITSQNADKEQQNSVYRIFSLLGKAEVVDEKLIPAITSLTSCGIAFAFRYIRAAMEGGIEMGIYPDQAKNGILQTLRGAIDLLEATGNHPEVEIDKVTTAGGITIKGLNEMEHAGFTSSVIKGLKTSNVK
ncbi:pyrroline-5-carboxylate reductase [Dysgonomonas sp. Marseille-P4677]|uniref:pyrroline-5-carboxylate reductase n=1 Tax=Dysgonomonas sp. Marseille-P4677 TaxID=2364790 RepID=UPI00191165AE|nr:pyrroline-5-carboxylate reductase [Dysgonomonas sp. Marseille-P4677]MBK5721245.1 pyrroline-5-carboxylate reductase [Dysgonomonas sp. Marseille-P4677]